jgi:RNA-binding protein
MTVDNRQRRRLRSEGQRLEPTVQVGKAGLTDGLKAELDSQLKRNHLVKVRVARGAAGGQREGEEEMARSLVESLGADLVERRGHTLLLYRRGRRGG